MCTVCLEKKEPLLVTSSKSNHKRVISKLKKKIQVKRKIAKKEDVDIVTSSSESSSPSHEETSDEAAKTDTDNSEDETHINDDDKLKYSSSEDDSAQELTNECKFRNVTRRRANENVFKKANELYQHLNLSIIRTPMLGDCLPQACILAKSNRKESLTDEEEEQLSMIKWSLVNLYCIGKTNAVTHSKYQSWRNFCVGDNLSGSLYVNCDDRVIFSHVFDKKIVCVTPHRRKDGTSGAHLTIHVPISGSKSRAKTHRVNVNSNHDMHYISNIKKMTREYFNIPELIKEDKLFVIQFYSAHYEGLRLTSAPSREITWPAIESHNIFHPSVDKTLCPMCDLITCTDEPSMNCILCDLWVHSSNDSQCLKYWKDIDVNLIEDDEDMHYYFPMCIDTLISYQKSTKEECNVDNLLNCLRSFNLEGVEIKDEVEINIIRVVLSEALGN